MTDPPPLFPRKEGQTELRKLSRRKSGVTKSPPKAEEMEIGLCSHYHSHTKRKWARGVVRTLAQRQDGKNIDPGRNLWRERDSVVLRIETNL